LRSLSRTVATLKDLSTMRPYRANSRDPSSEFERISLDDLSRPESPPQQVEPPTETNPPIASSLSPSRPIIIPRVSLRRKNTTGTSLHWRKPSYSRVDSTASPKPDAPGPSSQYDEDGGVDPDIREVEEGLNVALGTGEDIGSWLPTTRQPSIRKVERGPVTPQIMVEDTAAVDGFEPDERETAGLTVNASQIAGAAPVGRARTLSTRRVPAEPTGMLGYDLGALERRGSNAESSSQLSPTSIDGRGGSHPTALTPGGATTVMRHIRKVSQRVVNIANSDEQVETSTGFPFPGLSPKIKPIETDISQEFPFPALDSKASPVEKLSAEFNVGDIQKNPIFEKIELRGRSLYIFSPDNVLRNWLCNILLRSYCPFEDTLTIVLRSL
jgi:hypothetical protein